MLRHNFGWYGAFISRRALSGLAARSLHHRHGRALPGHPRLAVPKQGKVVDGRHKAGHDVEATGAAMLAPMRLVRAISSSTCAATGGPDKPDHDDMRTFSTIGQ